MSVKNLAAKVFAKRIHALTQKWANNPVVTQKKVLESLLIAAAQTKFGNDHHFRSITSHADFVQNVPVRDYEGLKSYIDLVVNGESKRHFKLYS